MSEYVKLKDGTRIPRLGMGTWYLGEKFNKRNQEIEAIRTGIDSGIRLIDTAEMYGEGAAEQLIGQVISDYNREDLFLVSKVYPHNAGKYRLRKSLNHSLQRMKTDYLDLYLLHWRGNISLEETVECMEAMVAEGKIRHWGVSNFDKEDMEELMQVPNGKNCMVNQVLYHMGSRGIEYDLLPWQREHGIPIMAYCPLAQAGTLRGQLLKNAVLKEIAGQYGISVMQLLLLFVLQQENVIAIPRSGNAKHVLENRSVLDMRLSEEDLMRIDKEFPAPDRKVPLDIV